MIVYYVTAHGYGHLVRACTVMQALDPALPVTVRSAMPPETVRHLLAGRPVEHSPGKRFDCGTLGPDSTSVDAAMTADAVEPLLATRDRDIAAEADFLREVGARVVVSDIAPQPLAAARRAGIPSLLVANFHWSGIYRHLYEALPPEHAARPRLERAAALMQADYDQGDLLLVPGLDVPVAACRHRARVGLVARRGADRRAELARLLDFDPRRPVYLVYLGPEGREGMNWQQLEPIEVQAEPLQLTGFNPPSAARRWIRPFPAGRLPDADLMASVDAVIAKPGYATTAEAMAHARPLLIGPRPHFVESRGIEAAINRWGGGCVMPDADFLGLRWENWLARIPRLRAAMRPVDADGAAQIARCIEAASRGGTTAMLAAADALPRAPWP